MYDCKYKSCYGRSLRGTSMWYGSNIGARVANIEDAAHAVDANYKGKSCGSIGDIGIFSFDAVKNLTAIEGGGITMKSSEMYERAKLSRYCGIGKSGFDSAASSTTGNWWEYNITELFIKMLPTNLHAAVASVQLKRLPSLQHVRYLFGRL